MKTDSEVLELLLESFQREMAPVQMSRFSRLFGPPSRPELGFVRQFSATKGDRGFSDTIVGVWRITTEKIEEMPAGFSVPETAILQNIYDHHHFGFTMPDASGIGRVSSQWGPRSGYGKRYRVTAGGIEDAGRLWIS